MSVLFSSGESHFIQTSQWSRIPDHPCVFLNAICKANENMWLVQEYIAVIAEAGTGSNDFCICYYKKYCPACVTLLIFFHQEMKNS